MGQLSRKILGFEIRTCESVLSESFSASSTSGTTANNQHSALVADIALDHLLGTLGGLDFVGVTRHNDVLANDFNLLKKKLVRIFDAEISLGS